MLVITRRQKEKIVFPTIHIEVQVLEVKGGQIRLGIEAPPHVSVFREELIVGRKSWNRHEPESASSRACPESLWEFEHRMRNHLNDVGLKLAILHQQLRQQDPDTVDSIIIRMEEYLQQLRRELDRKFASCGNRMTPGAPQCLPMSRGPS
jgi:carbon storage regulator